VIKVGGCERATSGPHRCRKRSWHSKSPHPRLGELEFFAEFKALPALEIHREVGRHRIFVGARSAFRVEMHARPTSEAKVEAFRFRTELGSDRSPHGSLKRLRGLSTLKEEAKIPRHPTRERLFGGVISGIRQLTRIGERSVEGRVSQPILG